MVQSKYTTTQSTEEEVTYLLHFDRPLGNENHRARHYCGKTNNLERRLNEHRQGTGAAIMKACKERGIDFQVAKVFKGYSWERKLKSGKNMKFYCSVCRMEKLARKLVPTPLNLLTYASNGTKQLTLLESGV